MNDVIPNDWELVNLGTLGSFAKGAGIRKDEALSGEIPAVRYGELYTDHPEILRAHRSFISAEISKSARPIKCGDILFAGSGETKEEIGKCTGFLGDYEAFAGGDIIVFRPNGPDPRFLAYMLNSAPIAKQKAQRAQGDAVVHIYPDALRRLSLPLPSLHEQQAIAAALSDADGVVAGLERVIAKKRLIKQGAMQDLLTARRRLPGFSGEWEEATLSELADIRSGGTPSTSDATLWDGDIAWVTPTDITALDGRKFLSGTTRTISRAGLRQSSAELLPEGTIVMTSRATIGECAISTIPLTTNQGFKNFIAKNRADRDFLYYLLTSQKKGFIELCSGSTFLEIGKTQLTGYTVRVPETKREQQAISTVLSDMDAEIQTLEGRLTKARAVKEGMMQNLLTGRVRLV
ncbi:restriction endonuclease subunit S [Phaeobacter sp. CAU 1743]|uniref:restriction endonuclease subunit S n=1 Tax=Phaeobacter sp. CAU 1743 TaxID=3140367 RepID=UPI00325BB274